MRSNWQKLLYMKGQVWVWTHKGKFVGTSRKVVSYIYLYVKFIFNVLPAIILLRLFFTLDVWGLLFLWLNWSHEEILHTLWCSLLRFHCDSSVKYLTLHATSYILRARSDDDGRRFCSRLGSRKLKSGPRTRCQLISAFFFFYRLFEEKWVLVLPGG